MNETVGGGYEWMRWVKGKRKRVKMTAPHIGRSLRSLKLAFHTSPCGRQKLICVTLEHKDEARTMAVDSKKLNRQGGNRARPTYSG